MRNSTREKNEHSPIVAEVLENRSRSRTERADGKQMDGKDRPAEKKAPAKPDYFQPGGTER